MFRIIYILHYNFSLCLALLKANNTVKAAGMFIVIMKLSTYTQLTKSCIAKKQTVRFQQNKTTKEFNQCLLNSFAVHTKRKNAAIHYENLPMQ